MDKENIKNKIKNLFGSNNNNMKTVMYTLGVLVVISIIFQAGVFVGFHKAGFSRDLRNNYYENFGPKKSGPMSKMGLGERFPNAHGAIGKIIKIDLPSIIVQDKDNIEKIVLIKDDTKILRQKIELNKEDLVIDSFIVVIGSPNSNGQIESKLIRIMPNPPILGGERR